ncbi:MAG TPA: hypothetical protein VEP90_16555 [Methylomirabilota bacterium]|nr:hypothetical protein [Methylomirabilota bacterium]
MEITAFLDMFRKALSQVDETYYGIDWWNQSQLNYPELYQDDPRQQAIQTYLARYGERVFCYEFYHQLRSLMKDFSIENPGLDSSVRLEAELRKRELDADLEELFDVKALDKEYIPDFLLHSPGDFDKQWLVIEVKSNPKTAFGDIRDDLSKIQKFISSYKYEKGIFLIVNNPISRIRGLLSDSSNQEWIRNNLRNSPGILFISKENRGSEIFECCLNNIPEFNS